jgi:hypothetical protein
MIILCGYKQPMDRLMDMDPGLARRFQERLDLEDYTEAELAEIAGMIMCR